MVRSEMQTRVAIAIYCAMGGERNAWHTVATTAQGDMLFTQAGLILDALYADGAEVSYVKGYSLPAKPQTAKEFWAEMAASIDWH